MNRQIARAKMLAADVIMGVPSLQKVIDRVAQPGSPIFAFHRVLPDAAGCFRSGMIITSRVFAAFLDWLSSRYQAIPLVELARLRRQRSVGGKPYCALTFDDGWRDNFLHAFPILRERQLPATVFLPVRFIGTNRRFWQERLWFVMRGFNSASELHEAVDQAVRSLPWCRRLTPGQLTFEFVRQLLLDRPTGEGEEFVNRLSELAGCNVESNIPSFMNWDEVQAMQGAGITFGSHTLNHTLLTRADPATAWQEIEGSRRELADRLGLAPESIAYPWGAWGPYTREQVKAAGYEIGLSSERRLVDDSFDRLLLPRIELCDSSVCATEQVFHAGKSSLLMARSAWGLGRHAAQAASNGHCPRPRIRIGFVIDSIDSWEDGGTEQQLLKLIGALDRSYFDPELYFLRPSLHVKSADLPCLVNVAGSWPEVKWYRPGTLINLIRFFRDRRPHIVQTFFRDATYYGALAATLAGVPITVVSVRNAGYWKRYRDRLPLMVISRVATHWQCNSRSVAEALESEDHIRPERIEVLPNAIDLEKFTPASPQERLAARQQLGLPFDAPVFVSVANLRPVKDLSTLIAAARRVQEDLPSAQFLLVGDGPLRQSLEAEVARSCLGEQVRFLGVIRDVRPCLAAADIGLLTSRSEASSNSVIEYMAMGLPSVLSDIPGNRDLVDQVFFEPSNAGDLAAKILALWSNPELRFRIGQRYRRRAGRFTPEALAQRLQGYYLALASATSMTVGGSVG
jgi:glycosyltransferase involved in cell wall biosynthesis/peptidoglycan/xylan/chitin deacetylase (PgdA/CDA1 family)